MAAGEDRLKKELEERVLFLAPTRRDGQITEQLLQKANLSFFTTESARELAQEISRGAGVILLSDAGVLHSSIQQVVDKLGDQPDWSELPVIVLTRPNLVAELRSSLGTITNVTFIERPAAAVTIVSALDSAVRSRRRQYQVRDKVFEIAQAAEQFEVMANAIPQLAWMSNPDGHVFWFNNRWNEFVGGDSRAMYGWGWTSFTDSSVLHEVVDQWKSSLETGEPFEMEYRLKGADGELRAFLSRAVPIREEGGHIVRWLCTYTDVEEQRRLNQMRDSLLESERQARSEAERAARIKDEFLATLSHELRTPLSSILGWTYLLRKSPGDESVVHDAADVIMRSGETLKALVDDLLDLSRIASGKLQLEFTNVILSELVKAQVDEFRPAAESKALSLDYEIEAKNEAPVLGDEKRLKQIVSNLLSNAIRFTPAKGSIRIELKYLPTQAKLSVIDSGDGIDPQFLSRLFDRFTQADASTSRKHGGMGIGLSLVRQFAEMHGGTAEVASAGLGQGSTFTVTLPLELSNTAVVSGESKLGLGGELGDYHVMVVDDDSGIREIVGRIITEAGANVTLADSADRALSLLNECDPDLVVSDIGMPGRDGYQFIAELRNRGIKVPAIALTAFVQPEDRRRALDAGFDEHLSKPVQPDLLIKTIRRLLNGHDTPANSTSPLAH